MEMEKSKVPYPRAGILLIISGALLIIASLGAGGGLDTYTAALVSTSMAFAVAMLTRKPCASLCVATGLVAFVHILPIAQLFESGAAVLPNLIFRLLRVAGMVTLLVLTIMMTRKKPLPKSPFVWILPLLLFAVAWLAGAVQTIVQCTILAQQTDAFRHILISFLSVLAQLLYTYAIGRHGLWLRSLAEMEK